MGDRELQIEVDILRERLQECRALLGVSYNIIFKPHQDILKRKEHKDNFINKLLEHGIIEEKKDEPRSRIHNR